MGSRRGEVGGGVERGPPARAPPRRRPRSRYPPRISGAFEVGAALLRCSELSGRTNATSSQHRARAARARADLVNVFIAERERPASSFCRI